MKKLDTCIIIIEYSEIATLSEHHQVYIYVYSVAAMLSFSSKKKERWRPRFLPDATQRGAICWQVMLDDSSQASLVDCFLAISADTLLLIEENTREIVFVTPCKSILGWATQTNR